MKSEDAERIVSAILEQITDTVLSSTAAVDKAAGKLSDSKQLEAKVSSFGEKDSKPKNGLKSVKMESLKNPPVVEDTNRRSRRKRKLNYLSNEHQEFRKLVRLGDSERLEEFLQRLEDPQLVNIRDNEGSTALNEISSKNSQFVRIADVLLKYQADVNVCDGLGNSPLHNALLYYPATFDMVQLLLSHGASMQSKNLSGWTPIQMSDDDNLKTYVAKNIGSDPSGTLDSWLKLTSKPKLVIRPPPSVSIKIAAESPNGSILKRRTRTEESVTKNSNGLLDNPSEAEADAVGQNDADSRLENGDAGDVDCGQPNTDTSTSRRGLKRKRESQGGEVRKKKIRFAMNDSAGCAIDPSFSDSE